MKKDNRIIKASFKGCPIKERDNFHMSKCIMPISIGQKVHEGEKFIATIKLVNRSFAECVILIDDTVQRHTLAIPEGSSQKMEELYTESLRQGDEWINTYKEHIEQNLKIPFKIIRWNNWLNHKNFQISLKSVKKRYNSDSKYKEAIDSNIFEFLSRYKVKNNCNFEWDKACDKCWDYLMEECAAMCLWVEENCEYEVYPNPRNKAMSATYEIFIKPKTSSLLKPVALRFKKYGTKTPQVLVSLEDGNTF